MDGPAFAHLETTGGLDVDSIAMLGSTGSYAYPGAWEWHPVAQLPAERFGTKPLIVGATLSVSEVDCTECPKSSAQPARWGCRRGTSIPLPARLSRSRMDGAMFVPCSGRRSAK